HQIESFQCHLRLQVFTLGHTIDWPFPTIGSHRNYTAMLLKCLSKEHTKICKCQCTFLVNVIALDNLMANQQMFPVWCQTGIAIGWLDHACNALCVQAIHDTLVRNE